MVAALLALLPTLRSQPAAPAAVAANPAPALPAPGDLTPAEEAELAEILGRTWEQNLRLRGSLGWRENVLLSPFRPVGRAFGRGELEAFLWRPLPGRWDFVTMLNGDVLRYFSAPPETGGEQQWFLHGEARWKPVAATQVALKGDAFFQDTVIDLSESTGTRIVAPTRAQGAIATATVRVTLPGGFSLEPVAKLKRTDYREFPGDYVEPDAGARLEWQGHGALRLSASWLKHWRRYSQRDEFTAGGRELTETHLRFRQQEGEIKIADAWTAGGKWNLAVTLGRLENRDRASGYFDYDQNRARLEAGWERGKWRLTVDGEGKRMEYRVQTVGIGIAPPPRIEELFDTTARVERTLSDAWTIFAEHRWERSRSNEAEFSYRDQTALAGVQRSF